MDNSAQFIIRNLVSRVAKVPTVHQHTVPVPTNSKQITGYLDIPAIRSYFPRSLRETFSDQLVRLRPSNDSLKVRRSPLSSGR